MLDYWTVQIGGEVGKDPAAQAFVVPSSEMAYAGDDADAKGFDSANDSIRAVLDQAIETGQIVTLQFHKGQP